MYFLIFFVIFVKLLLIITVKRLCVLVTVNTHSYNVLYDKQI